MFKPAVKYYIAVQIFWLSHKMHLLLSQGDYEMENLSEPFNISEAGNSSIFFMTHLLKCDAIFKNFLNDNHSPTILRSLK